VGFEPTLYIFAQHQILPNVIGSVILTCFPFMASVSRRRGSRIWTAFFRDEHGRQHCISTGTDDKRLALTIAAEYQKEVRQKRTVRQVTRSLDRLHELITGERISRWSLRQYATDRWLKSKRHETRGSTLEFYRKSVEKALTFFKARADLPISEISPDDVLSYRAHLADSVAPKTANHNLKTLKMIFKAARRDGVVVDDPTEFISGVKQTSAQAARRAFTADELSRVLPLCDPEWRSMVYFGLYLGQRLFDIATLDWSAIDRKRNEIRITTGKTGKLLILPLARPLRKHIEGQQLQAHGPIHPRAAAIVQAQGRTALLSNQFTEILAQAGLREHRSHVSRGIGRGGRRASSALSFHSLRHTTVSMLRDSGVSQSVAMGFAGHTSPEINNAYTHTGIDSLQKAADSLPDVT
jgi:integrase